ncbi:EAL domain-containing protein [Cereibacter sphaeroides]|uniref:EAL domain-containing protein n=1 Tax=Cereibacter sphaeroides TaxID=1063 RepID=UPI001F2320A8|nr:EAL domain-containing protein [Cereibacter sphaeroides]MCE6959486.1 EAL domain-containing protein [Cereibacter sphaeroides]MCE6973743.1 EAL domain-containing protein [Cereibacter sphaeroides]
MAQQRRPEAPPVGTPLDFAMDEIDRQTLRMVEQALRAERLALAWQPVVLARDVTRSVFHEGLIRVLDETGRNIPARDFMAAIETQELGRLIDCAALGMGLSALARNPGLRLSINMSARSIGYTRWMSTLKAGLRSNPTLGERLILEITESSAMQVPELVIAFMDELQREGISFALDDFGAGFTAFRYLKDFFFDIIKIDGQFIRNIHADADNQVLTQAMLSVARHFDMFTVAESVETTEEAEWLRRAGVNCLQGYLFGAPHTQPAWEPVSQRMTA